MACLLIREVKNLNQRAGGTIRIMDVTVMVRTRKVFRHCPAVDGITKANTMLSAKMASGGLRIHLETTRPIIMSCGTKTTNLAGPAETNATDFRYVASPTNDLSLSRFPRTHPVGGYALPSVPASVCVVGAGTEIDGYFSPKIFLISFSGSLVAFTISAIQKPSLCI